jgi:hypothetical protein
MKTIVKCVGVAVGMVGLVMTIAPSATAGLITYTETVTGSGSLGGTAFTDALITITATADTGNVMNAGPGILDVKNASTTLDVTGIGSGTFTGNMVTFVNQNVSPQTPAVGFADLTVGADVLDTSNPAFATYDLTTPIGPVSGPSILSTGSTFGTTAGNFKLTATSGLVTFEATTQGAVPEPSTLILTSVGFVGVLFSRFRHRARATG